MERAQRKDIRSSNFTPGDKQLLLALVNKYTSIIENKKTDANTSRQKARTWKRIEFEYNMRASDMKRSARQLKFKYESVKRDLRRRAQLAQKTATNSNGKNVKLKPSTEAEAMLFETIGLKVEEEATTLTTLTTITSDEDVIDPLQITCPPDNQCPPMVSIENDFYLSKPHTLRQRQPKNDQSTATAKFEDLADAKMELVKLQIENEAINRRHLESMHRIEIETMELKREEARLKVEILQKQLLDL